MDDLSSLATTPPSNWPTEAERILRDVLRDPSLPESVRAQAARLAALLPAMQAPLAEALLAVVEEPDAGDSTRSLAAAALGPVLELHASDPLIGSREVGITEETFHRIQDVLRMVYRDPDVPNEVRRRVLEAAARAPSDWHKDAIRAAYYSGDDAWRLTAVTAMRHVASFEEQILESLELGDGPIREAALWAAAHWEVLEAWPRVRSLLASPSTPKPVLLAAISAAGTIGGDEGQSILHRFADSADAEIAQAASAALLVAVNAAVWEEASWEGDDPA